MIVGTGAARYWVVNWCSESWIQRSTSEGWETVQVFRGHDHKEQAAEALRLIDGTTEGTA